MPGPRVGSCRSRLPAPRRGRIDLWLAGSRRTTRTGCLGSASVRAKSVSFRVLSTTSFALGNDDSRPQTSVAPSPPRKYRAGVVPIGRRNIAMKALGVSNPNSSRVLKSAPAGIWIRSRQSPSGSGLCPVVPGPAGRMMIVGGHRSCLHPVSAAGRRLIRTKLYAAPTK